jgi:hypothetical protein
MWLAGSLLAVIDYEGAKRTADDLVASHSGAATLRLKSLPPVDAGEVLRYGVMEDARARIDTWAWCEVVLGAVFFLFLLFGTGEGMAPLVIALFMLSIAVGQAFLLNPAIISIGRQLDFVIPGVERGDRGKLAVLEMCMAGLEALKWAVGLFLAFLLIRHKRSPESGGAWDQVNVINKADHSHINR